MMSCIEKCKTSKFWNMTMQDNLKPSKLAVEEGDGRKGEIA